MTHVHSSLSSDICLFSICRATYIDFRLVERRLWWDVIKLDETSSQIHCERLIKFDESDSLNLMSGKTSSYQMWRKRLIKLFEKKDSFSTFWWVIFCSDIWCKELNLAENHFLREHKCLCEIVMISEHF